MNIENNTDKPILDLRKFFNGKVKGWGIAYDFFSRTKFRFLLDLEGQWEGEKGTLTDYFTFTNGLKKQRTWTIEFMDEHRYKATAPDVIGEGQGTQQGNTAHSRYHLILPGKNGKKADFYVDDWLYMIDENTIMNRVKFRKWGLVVSELHIAFSK